MRSGVVRRKLATLALGWALVSGPPGSKGGPKVAIHISDDFMALEVNGAVIATARFRQYAAADLNGAWIVSTHPARLFSRNQAITALSLAERLAAGYGEDDPFVQSWRVGLFP
jgi:hypothetical protein